MRSRKKGMGIIQLILLLVCVTLITVAVIFYYTGPAVGSPSCMTYNEARVKWPHDHLWWRTSARCWSNIPGSRSSARKRIHHDPNGNDAVKHTVQKQPVIALAKADPTVIWPPVIAAPKLVDADLYNVTPITQWPLLLDIDEITMAKADQLDECCWPDLDELVAFEKRWENIPVAWRTK